MKDEATAEQLAMARRVYTQFIIDNTPGAGPDDVPKFDDNAHGVRIALAAIIETTNRIQRLLDNCGEPCPQCWDAIERGDHLKGQDHG